MRAFLAAAMILSGLVQAAAAADLPWPALRGSAAGEASTVWRPGSGPERIAEWHFTGRTDRRFQVGLAVWASPALAVVRGRPMAFIGGCDQTLHALDLLAKEERWFKVTNGPIQGTPVVGRVDGREVVFFASCDRTVYAHQADSGRRLWTRELVPATPTMVQADVSSGFLHGQVLYVTCFVHDRALARSQQTGWLIALKAATGEELWREEIGHGFLSSPVGRVIRGRLCIFVAARKGLLQAYDASGDRPVRLWQHQMAQEVLGSPVIEEATDTPRLFLGSKFGKLVALDAYTGDVLWERMAGNWIDNTACCGQVDGQSVVFVGSHDYCIYAFRAADGEPLWRRRLGGEVYSAPCFFLLDGEPTVAAGALDNHLYVLDARNGSVRSIYYEGQPVWDKVSKGETLWGSPVALQAGEQTALVHGSFSGTVYTLPLVGECSVRTKVRSAGGLWVGLAVVGGLFALVVLPAVLLWPRPARASQGEDER